MTYDGGAIQNIDKYCPEATTLLQNITKPDAGCFGVYNTTAGICTNGVSFHSVCYCNTEGTQASSQLQYSNIYWRCYFAHRFTIYL